MALTSADLKPLGKVLGGLGPLWAYLGVVWGGLRALLGAHEAVLPRLEAVWGSSGDPKCMYFFMWETSRFLRSHLSNPNRLPRNVMMALEAIMGPFETMLGPSWDHLGPLETILGPT